MFIFVHKHATNDFSSKDEYEIEHTVTVSVNSGFTIFCKYGQYSF